jgi:hypothetical protein
MIGFSTVSGESKVIPELNSEGFRKACVDLRTGGFEFLSHQEDLSMFSVRPPRATRQLADRFLYWRSFHFDVTFSIAP